jgi:hypothetical protein
MPDETDDREQTTTEGQPKPTITIAEMQGDDDAPLADTKPTITIAEKDGGN